MARWFRFSYTVSFATVSAPVAKSFFFCRGFLFTIVLFVIIGTICDYLTNDLNSQTELIMWKNEASTDLTLSQRFSTGNSFTFQALMSFSLKSNLRKILDTSSTANSVSIFHGVRVLCMVWIVCGHSYSFAIQWMLFSKEACLLFSPKLLCLTENPQKITKGPQNILSQILINGTFSVDCFFFIRFVQSTDRHDINDEYSVVF